MIHSRVWRQFRAGLIISDALAIIAVYIVADILRCHLWMHIPWPELLIVNGQELSSVRVHMKVLVFLPVIWPLILSWLGWYDQKWRPTSGWVRITLAASAVLGLSMAGLALLFERELYPRIQIGFVAALLPATTLAVRGISTRLGRWFSSRHQRHVLMVGTDRDAVRFRRLLRAAAMGRPAVIGHLRGPWEANQPQVQTGAILGELDQLAEILENRVVDEVIFACPPDALGSLLPSIRLCEEVGVTAHVLAEPFAAHSVPEVIDFLGVPLIAYAPARHSPEQLALKRAFDLLFAIIGILITGPIMLLCIALIRLTSPGPAFFTQIRSGLNGRKFRMLKFRTMTEGAEAKQAEIAHLNESTGPVFKIEDDPRVTWVGRMLRKWSLDELPQLFNVLKGDMSFVGPRPPIPSEVGQYDRWQRRRLSMRPGLTCLWQIKGRHRIGFQEWMRLDLFYIDHWSLKLDFLIMWRTIGVVLSGSGA